MSVSLEAALGCIGVGFAVGAWAASQYWRRRCDQLEREMVQLALSEARARRERGGI